MSFVNIILVQKVVHMTFVLVTFFSDGIWGDICSSDILLMAFWDTFVQLSVDTVVSMTFVQMTFGDGICFYDNSSDCFKVL
jgi:hypothetical protein